MDPLEDSNETFIAFGRPRGTQERLWTMEGYWELQVAEVIVPK